MKKTALDPKGKSPKGNVTEAPPAGQQGDPEAGLQPNDGKRPKAAGPTSKRP